MGILIDYAKLHKKLIKNQNTVYNRCRFGAIKICSFRLAVEYLQKKRREIYESKLNIKLMIPNNICLYDSYLLLLVQLFGKKSKRSQRFCYTNRLHQLNTSSNCSTIDHWKHFTSIWSPTPFELLLIAVISFSIFCFNDTWSFLFFSLYTYYLPHKFTVFLLSFFRSLYVFCIGVQSLLSDMHVSHDNRDIKKKDNTSWLFLFVSLWTVYYYYYYVFFLLSF